MDFIIRPMNEQDWPDVAEIYRQGIATGKATFQSEIPEYKDWNASHLSICRYVAVADEESCRLDCLIRSKQSLCIPRCRRSKCLHSRTKSKKWHRSETPRICDHSI